MTDMKRPGRNDTAGRARPVPGEPPRARVPDAVRRTLGGGLRLVAVPRTELPQIVLKVLIPAGSAIEEVPGTAALVGDLLAEGTERWSADELNLRLDRLGAAVSVHVAHDFTEIEALLLSETVSDALPILAEMVVRPIFPKSEVERVRREALDALEARHDEPANVADDLLAESIFGPVHPYGRLSAGTMDGVRAVSAGELRAFHQARYRPDGSSVVASGDFDVERLATALNDAFSGWVGRVEELPRPPAPHRPVAAGRRRSASWDDAAQAEIRLGAVGMERRSPDWVSAAVANYILGGSTITGRFGANLREDKGWTYGARSGFSAALQPGGWVADTAVDTSVMEDAIRELRVELRSLRENGPSTEELHRAQEALVLSLPRAFETPARIVNRLLTLEAFGLAEDYWQSFPDAVRRVTDEEVVRIVERYLNLDDLVEVVVG